MTAFLYRLGRSAFHHPWRVIAVWVALLAAFCVVGFGFGGTLADSFDIPGTESQAALDRLDAVFPQAAGGSAQAIVVAPAGQTVDDAAEKAAIGRFVTAAGKVQGVESAASPFSKYSTDAVSGDREAAIVSVQFTAADDSVTDATKTALIGTGSIIRDAGMRVAFSGQAFQTTSVGVSPAEGLGLLFAGVVLVVTFGSLLAAGLPLLSAIIGVTLSYAAIRIVALFTTVSTSAPTLALMLGLAVGIDYGLFIISRHREQLATGMTVEESIPAAVATAGTAVSFAGVTVIIALTGLVIVGIPFLSIMGVGAAFAVLVAVGSSVSLLPAVLALGGARFVPKPGSRVARRAVAVATGDARTLGARWVGLIAKAPVVAVVAVVAILGVLAVPALSLQLALPNNGQQPVGSDTRTAYDLTGKYFGQGRNGPLVLLADVTQNNDFITALDKIKARISTLPDVKAVGTPTPNETLDTAIVQVIPKSGPADPATVALVNRIRALEPSFKADYDIPVSVTGTTAVQIDVSTRLLNALLPFVLVVVGLSVLLLMAVFRSLVVPLKAAVGFLLSLFASLGVTVAVYQWGWFGAFGTTPAPLLSFLPILVIAILFGLSMDYEVFLVSGMREAWVHGGDAPAAVRRGFAHGARVVTAAALIMLFVFVSFIPDGGQTIKPIATSLAVGIAFDAFLVRMTLVPAVMLLFRRAAWYLPRWLQRVLPAVDIEGEGLASRREEHEWAEGEQGLLLSAQGLTPPAPFGDEPIDVRLARGQVASIVVPAGNRRGVVATLTGHLVPADGRLQVDGHPAPSEAAAVRRLAAPVLDDGSTRASTVAELLGERLRATPRGSRSGSVPLWLERIRTAQPDLAQRIAPGTELGALVAEERLVVLAAAALAGGAEVLVVDTGDVGPVALQRLTTALFALVDDGASALVVTAPADSPAAATLDGRPTSIAKAVAR